jgi:hypothetical protein
MSQFRLCTLAADLHKLIEGKSEELEQHGIIRTVRIIHSGSRPGEARKNRDVSATGTPGGIVGVICQQPATLRLAGCGKTQFAACLR